MQLGNEGKTLTKRKMMKTCYMRFQYLPWNVGDMCALFLNLDAKILKFACVKFEQKLTSS